MVCLATSIILRSIKIAHIIRNCEMEQKKKYERKFVRVFSIHFVNVELANELFIFCMMNLVTDVAVTCGRIKDVQTLSSDEEITNLHVSGTM